MSLTIDSLKTLLEINRKINTIDDVRVILNDISKAAGSYLSAEGASILLVDKNTGNLYFEVSFGDSSNKLKNLIVPKGKGIAGYVAMHKECVIVNDVEKDERFYKDIDSKTKLQTKALIASPLIHKDEVIGVIEVVNPKKGYFDEIDAELIKLFSEQAAIAISNALLYKIINDKVKEIEYLYKISNLTARIVEKKKFFSQIVEYLSKIFNSRRVSIMLLDDKTNELYIEEAIGIDEIIIKNTRFNIDKDNISTKIIKNGKSVLCNNINDSEFKEYKNSGYLKDSFMSVPIILKNIIIGIVNVSEPIDEDFYIEENLKILETIAYQIGYSYESIKSYEQKIEYENTKKEIQIMRSLQQALLINDFSQFTTLSIYAISEPATTIGGDFYDIYKFDDYKLAFLIADVSGKGLPASLFMAVSRSVIKANAFTSSDAGEVLSKANGVLFLDSKVGMFVTVFYCIVDLKNMIINYSNAGHNLQYIYRKNHDDFVSLSTRGHPLGIMSNYQYISKSMNIESGDIIFSVTDGITEACNSSGVEFGIERIFEIIRKLKNTSSENIVSFILKSVKEWAKTETETWDDMTILVVKIP